jgi:hypothetical protein
MGRTIDEVIDALPKSRRARIERRFRELSDQVESLQQLRRAKLITRAPRRSRSKRTARS